MNETIQTLLARRSVRNFQQKQVPQSKLDQIVQAGLHAATAMNRQSWYFTVVQDASLLERISKAVAGVMMETGVPSLVERASESEFSCFYHAPTVVFLSGDGTAYSNADCANAAQNMCVAATALGLGSCYIASFAQAFKSPAGEALLAVFDLPQGYSPVFSVALGFTDGELPPLKTREQKVSYIR